LRVQAAAHVVPFTTRTQRSSRCGRNSGFSSASGAAAYQEQRMRVIMGCAGSTTGVAPTAVLLLHLWYLLFPSSCHIHNISDIVLQHQQTTTTK
jgi:hypothetical protein